LGQQTIAPTMAGRATAGAAWLIASRLVSRGADFVLLVVLGRVLTPSDFGLVAIAMTLVVVVEAVFDLPLVQSLIRIGDIERAHLDTAFTLGALRGIALSATLVALAWPFASFYNDARLIPLICLLGVAPAARGMVSPGMVMYAKAISFRRDFILETASKLIAVIAAIGCALRWHSHWAIAVNTLVTPVATALISYGFAPYRPRLTLSRWPAFAAFLGWASAAQALSAINWQFDRLMLGRLTTSTELGRFSMASDISFLPLQALVVPLLRPLTAAFSLIRDEPDRLAAAYAKTSAAILLGGLPVMAGLSALAGPSIQLVLGERWLAAAPVLHWLALAVIPAMFVTPLGPLAMALDRTNIFLRQTLIEFCLKIPALIVGASLFGIAGVVAARLLLSVIMAAVAIGFARTLTGLSVSRQILGCWRVFASGAAMYAVLRIGSGALPDAAPIWMRAVDLCGLGLLGLLAYAVLLFLFWSAAGQPDGAEAALFARMGGVGRRAAEGPRAAIRSWTAGRG
jgi:O-antigen/teichoic acid export membrane protein